MNQKINLIYQKSLNHYFTEYNTTNIVSFINAWSYYCLHKNREFNKALSHSINLPDGSAVVTLTSISAKQRLQRITGFDFLLASLEYARKNRLFKVTFIGSFHITKNILQKKLKNTSEDFILQFIELPFQPGFQKKDVISMHQSLQNFKPDIIYVSLGAPKQEIFTNQHLRGYTDVKFIANIGAALNFFAGTEKRAPKFLQKIGLEGIYRIFIDLKKHLTKDFKSYPFIIKEIIKVKLYEKRKKH